MSDEKKLLISEARLLSDEHFLRRVAQMYYEDDQTQDTIAETLYCSRATVGKALQRAKERRIVRITVAPDERSGYLRNLARQGRTRLGLDDLVLVTGQESNTFSRADNDEQEEVIVAIARAAHEYLDEMLTDTDTLAVSGGRRFLRNLVSHARPTKRLPHLRVVATIGSVDVHSNYGDANLIAYDLAAMYGADYTWFPCPAFMKNAEQVQHARNMPVIEDAYALMQQATIMLTSLWLPDLESLAGQGILGLDTLHTLKSSYHPVADINHWLLDASGNCITELMDPPPYYLSGLEFSTLQARVQRRETRTMMVVGGDSAYAPAIRAAIRAGIVNILVTDHLTAGALMELE